MSARRVQRGVVLGALVAAVLILLVVIGANLTHGGVGLGALDGIFTSMGLVVWNTIGVVAFLVLFGAVAFIYFRPASLIRVLDSNADHTGPHLYIGCPECRVYDLVTDTGQRPLAHFCPNCGREGLFSEDDPQGNPFEYTQVEVKLGCTNCSTTFSHPEPFRRPLYSKCPSCGAFGVIRQQAPVKMAIEAPVTCHSCDYSFHTYTIEGELGNTVTCPKCGEQNPVVGPAAPEHVAEEHPPEEGAPESFLSPMTPPEGGESRPTHVLCDRCRAFFVADLGRQRPLELACPHCHERVQLSGQVRTDTASMLECSSCGTQNTVLLGHGVESYDCQACGVNNPVESVSAA